MKDIAVANITDTAANLTFTTGYDYNNTQTFVVQRDVDGKLRGFISSVEFVFAWKGAFAVQCRFDS